MKIRFEITAELEAGSKYLAAAKGEELFIAAMMGAGITGTVKTVFPKGQKEEGALALVVPPPAPAVEHEAGPVGQALLLDEEITGDGTGEALPEVNADNKERTAPAIPSLTAEEAVEAMRPFADILERTAEGLAPVCPYKLRDRLVYMGTDVHEVTSIVGDMIELRHEYGPITTQPWRVIQESPDWQPAREGQL